MFRPVSAYDGSAPTDDPRGRSATRKSAWTTARFAATAKVDDRDRAAERDECWPEGSEECHEPNRDPGG